MADEGTRFARVQIDEDGYLFVETRVSEVDPQEILDVFLETMDPALVADRALRDHPDLDPVAGALAVLKDVVRGGD